MSSPAVQSPPAQVALPVPPPPPLTRLAPRGAAWRRATERRALAAGLALSVALHVLAVLASRYFITFAAPQAAATRGAPGRIVPASGIRVYQIQAVDAVAWDEATTLRPRPEAPSPTTATFPEAAEGPATGARGAAPGAGGEAGGRVLSPAERLRPRETGDPRLWAPLPLLVERNVTPAEAARENLYGRLEELSDSLAIEADAAHRAMDWTIKGPDGKRWGISSEGIHLGDITLPAPSFGAPAGRRDEVNGRMREWGEIQDQADRARIRDRFDERARAIREQKDREREQSKPKEQGKQEEKKPPPGTR